MYVELYMGVTLTVQRIRCRRHVLLQFTWYFGTTRSDTVSVEIS
jgi:hypothetical protein